MAGHYRIYIRSDSDRNIRFQAMGNGLVAEDGLEIFQWLRSPANIERLRRGVRNVFELRNGEAGPFLEYKLKDAAFVERMEQKCGHPSNSLETVIEGERARFVVVHKTGVQKLEAIASCTEDMVIPKILPRRKDDAAGWLYLVDLKQMSLEVYGFNSYKNNKSRLAFKTLLYLHPYSPPGYYIKIPLSGLQAMDGTDWTGMHELHAESLKELWQQNRKLLQTVPFVDNLPFHVLYGSAFDEKTSDGRVERRSTRITSARLKETLARMHTRGLPKREQPPKP
ncbi:hypothetical protein F5Y15DRAFT_346308 [Xylariaceae sp. FL0016]|nr:hypothetical protein F5Y15DRAFT_346308 [Xylariaceae sp. FL0016]